MRYHAGSGQMYVNIDGKIVYLGKQGTQKALIAYRRAIGDLAYEKAHQEILDCIDCLQNERKQAEAVVASLAQEICLVDKELEKLKWKAESYMLEDPSYPNPPLSFGRLATISLPSISCIYFLHNLNGIEYVGKTKALRERFGATIKDRHHACKDDDEISWLEFPDEMLEYIECYYIWLVKPMRNFGNDNNKTKQLLSDMSC